MKTSMKTNITKEWIADAMKEFSRQESVDGEVVIHQFLVTVLMKGTEKTCGGYCPSLGRIAYDIDQGDCIGEVEKVDCIQLAPDQVIPALLNVGIDGTCLEDWLHGEGENSDKEETL